MQQAIERLAHGDSAYRVRGSLGRSPQIFANSTTSFAAEAYNADTGLPLWYFPLGATTASGTSIVGSDVFLGAGRFVAPIGFYNERRLHQGLGTPMAVWREGAAPGAYGHVDNASVLTTCPQADQKQQQTKLLAA